MSLTMYSASVPVLQRMLGNALAWLDKAEAHAVARGFSPDAYLALRLAPDMLPFSKQIQIASDNAKACAARLAGHEVPVHRAAWRPGDQRVFVADIRKIAAKLGWQPTTTLEQLVAEMVEHDKEEARKEAEHALANQTGDFDYGRASSQLAEAAAQLATLRKMRNRAGRG